MKRFTFIILIPFGALLGIAIGLTYVRSVLFANPIPEPVQIEPYQIWVCQHGCADIGKALYDAYQDIDDSPSVRLARKWRGVEFMIPGGTYDLKTPIHIGENITVNGNGATVKQQPMVTMDGGGNATLDNTNLKGAALILVSGSGTVGNILDGTFTL